MPSPAQQAKETPEPIYDLEDCNLKDVPAGVFVMCKVLRKEALTLSKNKLSSLAGGGTLDDLVLLQSLNLSYNRFKKLPEDIYKLENLRVRDNKTLLYCMVVHLILTV